jgi:subtilisin family serine protease
VLRAIDWCLDHDVKVINLSLGTVNPEHRSGFEEAVARCIAAGTVIVSAVQMNRAAALPGSLDGVVGVVESEEYGAWERDGKLICSAPPYPRDIPGVPRERNLKGVSFSVGRVSARIAKNLAEEASLGVAALLFDHRR